MKGHFLHGQRDVWVRAAVVVLCFTFIFSIALNIPRSAAQAVVLLTFSSSSNTVSASSSPSFPENFTIIVLPDTQFYSSSYPSIFENQTKWIVQKENEYNIVFVTHLGDIVDSYNDNNQWRNADNAMSILDNKVPYTVLPGNHDMFGNSSAPIYESYFPNSRYEGRSYWGGSYDPSSANSSSPNMNNYQLFSWGGMDFITLSLQYEPPADVLSWADNVLNNYSNRRAIISTHSYLNPDGSLTDTGGSEIYNKVVVPENNVFLVLCGHMTESCTRIDNLGGRVVYQLLSDYQDLPNGGNGYLRIMEFVPSESTIYVKTYSPYLDNYMTDPTNQFELSYPEGLLAPSLISPKNNEELVDNTPTFEWTSVSNPGGVTYQIQINDNVDFSSPIYFASGLVENTHILLDENALALGVYFWRVRAVDNGGNVGLWSSVWRLFITTENRWTQVDWGGGPTKPSLQVGTWDNTYDNFYDNENVNWLVGVRLENYLTPISGVANYLIISELASRGPGGSADEFVELYNPTDDAVSIAGWDLQYFTPGTGWTTVLLTYPSGATIPAYSFYLAANPNGYSPPGSGPATDYYTVFSLADGSTTSPRGVRLRDSSGLVIDTVVYGGDGNYTRAEAEGGRTALGASVSPQSVERKAQNISTAASMTAGGTDENSGNGYDSDNNYNDWVRQDFRNPQNSSSPLEYPITSRFMSAGWFESSIFDAESSADWKFIGWSESKPSGTSIVVKARTGNDNDPYDGGWSDWYQHSNGAENALMPNNRYLQYRVELSTTNDTNTPELLDILINYLDSTPPPTPSLVSPENGVELLDNTPTFEWTSVSDPSGVTYQIEIDDNSDFGSPVYYAVDLTTITHTLPDEDALALFVQYFWHVRAKDGVGNVGDWSEEWNFTVVPIGAVGVLLMPLLMLLPFALMLRRQNRRCY